MKKTLILIVLLSLTAVSSFAERKGPWTKEQAWEWYRQQPWMRGCNYMSADCANRIDQWQELGFEERLETQKQELALAQSIGFNTLRLIFAEEGFGVWYADHDGFMERFERTLALCDSYGMRAVIVLGNDCSRPKQLWKFPTPGPQKYDWGYHGGRKQSQHGSFPGAMGYTSLDDPDLAPAFYEMCREVMTTHKDDKRIVMWNLWNEPGNNNRRDVTPDNLRKLFELAWEIDPSQPLAADLWQTFGANDKNRAELVAAELSDIISYHCYSPFDQQVRIAKELKERFDRPMINTEWMARIRGNNIDDCYPFFEQEGIGCTMWGFVAGKYQTYEPWESMWKELDAGRGQDYDLTKWFHDLYRPSLRPYDPKEIDIIKHVNEQADNEFSAKQQTVRTIVARNFTVLGEDMWYGYRRTSFDFHGHKAWVVEPSLAPLDGKPWTWTMQWAEAFVDRTGVLDLLKKGYHHVTIDIFDDRGDDESLGVAAEFQSFLRTQLGFADKARLVGMSWGGFFSVRYAASYPQNVAKIYLDAPLLVFGKDFNGDIGPWAKMKSAKWAKNPAMPVNMAARIAQAKIPVLLLYGGQDQTVIPSENCELFAKRFQEAGGDINIQKRDLFGHHPHGLDPDKTAVITGFFEK